MQISEFRSYMRYLLEEDKFRALMGCPAFENPLAAAYLKDRKISNIEAYFYQGDFTYRGKNYRLEECLVVPLRDPNPERTLRGVWIRFIRSKRFFIWMLDLEKEPQKYWIPDDCSFSERVWVCESIFDAVSLRNLLGVTSVVACLGAAPSGDLLKELRKAPEVILALDKDPAGFRSSLQLLTSNPQWGIIRHEEREKDYNDIHSKMDSFSYKILTGIQAKVYIKSEL